MDDDMDDDMVLIYIPPTLIDILPYNLFPFSLPQELQAYAINKVRYSTSIHYL